MLRKSIRQLGTICGYLAGVFLAGIAVATFAQISARQFGIPIDTTELSGFFLAASRLGLYLCERGSRADRTCVPIRAGTGASGD